MQRRNGPVRWIIAAFATAACFTVFYLTTHTTQNHARGREVAHPPRQAASGEKREKPSPASQGATPQKSRRTRIAIVIDDFAIHPELEEELLTLPIPFTAAVIPNRPRSNAIAQMATTRGHEVLVHMPMAPLIPSLGEKDALQPEMSPDEVAKHVRQALESMPQAVGVSNHQGSRATANAELMAEVLEVLRERHMFFLDSRTTPRSVAGEVARGLAVPYIARDVFLDNVREERAVRQQIRELVRVAEKRGWAVGIAHVNRATAEALQEAFPELEREGVAIVPLSELVHSQAMSR